MPANLGFQAGAATYGHFGCEDQGFSWEKTDKVDELRNILGLK